MHKSSVLITSELQHKHNEWANRSGKPQEHVKSLSNLSITSAMNWLAAWACSPGGPGRKRDEHRGGRSTLGTYEYRKSAAVSVLFIRILICYCPTTVTILAAYPKDHTRLRGAFFFIFSG